MTVANGVIYALGNNSDCNDISTTTMESFDPSKGVWQSEPSVPECLHGSWVYHTLVAVGDKLYATIATWTFDTKSKTWSQDLPSLQTPRVAAAAATLDGKLYVAGGITSGYRGLSSVEVFDPQNGTTWTYAPSMSFERALFSLTSL